MSICLYGFDAILVNESELLDSRIRYAGMTEERRCKYGIDKPKTYYVGEKELKVVIRYRGTEIECVIDSVLTNRCTYVVAEGVARQREHRVFAHRKDDSFISSDGTRLTGLVLDEVVTDVVKQYVKYHDEAGNYVDVEADMMEYKSGLTAQFDAENRHRVEEAGRNERLNVSALRQRFKKGELTQQEYQKALKAERIACSAIEQAVERERNAYLYQGCLQFCVTNYGIKADEFLSFMEKHQVFLRIWTILDSKRHLI